MTQTFLRIADVCRVTGLPRATIYEMVSKNIFPKQVRLSPRAVGWIESEILKSLSAMERDVIQAIARRPRRWTDSTFYKYLRSRQTKAS